jgi:hypothetical protein
MDQLKQEALKFVGDKAWTGELALRLGAHLAQAVNTFRDPSGVALSGQKKCELVCQTILALLDDVEKAGKEHAAESTEKVSSTIHLDEIRNLVRNHLPVTLTLIVSAARGEFDLAAAKKAASGLLSCLVPYLPCLASAASAVALVPVPAGAAPAPAAKAAPPQTTETQPSAVPEPPKESEIQAAAPAAPLPTDPPAESVREPENV